MASYFNKTRGLVTVSLRTGESAAVGPKKTLVVTPAQDRSASILSRVRKGLLIPLKDRTPKSVLDSEPEPTPVPEPAPAEKLVEVPSFEWTKSKLLDHTVAMGLDVPSSWTKVEILEAIEEAGE